MTDIASVLVDKDSIPSPIGATGLGGSDNGSKTLLELVSCQNPVALHQEISRQQSLLSQQRAKAENLKRLGIAWHNIAVTETAGAAKHAQGWLQQASRAAPSDYEAMAFLGSANTMVARDAWNPATKARLVNRGVQLLDRAVRMAPNNVSVRIARMMNSLALPAFLGRGAKVREDLLQLNGPLAEQIPHPVLAAELSFRLGELMQHEGRTKRALDLFQQARAQAPDSHWAQRAAHNCRSLTEHKDATGRIG
ncbi:MAG: hypothetical protein N838_26790 [Thiohalocapsa sp. PB-PSB1]|jgi:tetratricopeptide (TPR) repeat protein|nr:MAG: hypothetical protein N838_18000 [Thiohalocapsa sp. PB-PSB1]QQO56433.1 MAG: hypothetical protein N838_26790 [Thiohalocapsa sp. PB-PSB1]HCS90846.1 hypothetical protein [Chromatiaceae bacterium]